VSSIGQSAFNSCTSLTSVTIPNSVTSIGNYAFDSCRSLASVTFLSNPLPLFGGDNCFTHIRNPSTAYVQYGVTNTSTLQKFFTYIVVNAPIFNTCFPAGTPIVTNQGIIPIEKINPSLHTIRNKQIIGITKTITEEKHLVCFEKDSLSPNIPSKKTMISKNHVIFYKGNVMKAKHFVERFENVYKVKYNGEILYNVLMEEHDKMMINNLICETLHPKNYMAKLYKELQNLTPLQQYELIKESNEFIKQTKCLIKK
jgi:hypothetical protein